MGLSFHYKGSIAKPEFLPGLIDDVRDIVTVNNWEFIEYESEFPLNSFGKPGYNDEIYGISFTPSGCETVSVCFLSNGRLSSHFHLKFYGKTDKQAESSYLYMLSVKTQYAGVETHQFIIRLFRYLNNKYFTGFELSDEGDYWETNDIDLLRANFKRNAAILSSFSSALEFIPTHSDETIEDYFKRLLQIIRDKGL